MSYFDKATALAVERFNAESCSSHSLAEIRDDPRFKAILQDEEQSVASGSRKSPYVVSPCSNPLAKKENPNCTVESMLVSSKKTRTLLITPANSGAAFSVVSGNLEMLQKNPVFGTLYNFNPGKVDIVPNGQLLQGPCSSAWSHLTRTFDTGRIKAKERSDNALKLECFSDWELFPWLAKPKKYPVHYNTCSRSLSTEIHVYPDIEFGMGFEFKYQKEEGVRFVDRKLLLTDSDRANKAKYDAAAERIANAENVLTPKRSGKRNAKLENRANNEIVRSKKEQEDLVNRPSKLGWEESSVQKFKFTESLSLFGFYKFSNIELELKHVMKNVKEKAEAIGAVVKRVESIVRQIEKLSEESDKAASALATSKVTQAKKGFTITYPVVNVKLSGLWEEIEGSPECQYGAALVFAAKPLIGVEFKFDLTYAVLAALGPWGKGISEIKKGMEKADVSTMAIVLSVNGKANLETRLEMNSMSTLDSANVQVQVEITLKLEIKVVQFRKVILKYDVVVDIGGSGESGIVFTGKISPVKFSIDVEWTGVKATIVSNTTVTKSVEGRDEPPKVTPYKGTTKKREDDIKESDTEENEKSYKIKGQKFMDTYIYVFK